MARLTGPTFITQFNPHETEDTAMHAFGQQAVDASGNIYRYAKAGGSGISAGKLQLAPSPKTNHHNVSVASAASVGDLEVTVTLGATAATLNEYEGGRFVINDADGEGVSYEIASNPAADASASLTLTLAEPLVEALTTDSQVSLFHNAWNGVQESTTQTLQSAGVPLVDIAAGEYGWLMTRGVTGVLADESLTLGAIVTVGSSTAGAVEEMDDVTAPITETLRIGRAVVAGVDTEYRPVELQID